MPGRAPRIAILLFFSGMCALVYQVAWLRELRLVFGASTPASAAVLAVFMGGLGYGSLKLGSRADGDARPLTLYGNLEVGIAILSAITPLLMWLVRTVYIALGGTVALGTIGGTLVRLVLAALVLLPPTFLMGGTLPAAAKAAIHADDIGRRSTALLYGLNTLGAVTGAFLSTFVLLEVYGTRFTLWLGCGINGLVGLAARAYDRKLADEEARAAPAVAVVGASKRRGETPAETEYAADVVSDSAADTVKDDRPPAVDVHPLMGTMASTAEAVSAKTAPPPTIEVVEAPSSANVKAKARTPYRESPLSRTMESESEAEKAERRLAPFVLAAAAGVGFAFLLMELVWYRMLSPLLGGSSYTFGLILAVALAGIGTGGLLYSLRGAQRPVTLAGFAGSCVLEAAMMALPYALGDRVALMALFMRPFGTVGLWGHVFAWTLVTGVVVFPASLVAGYQFPLLIALLGRAKKSVAVHVGRAYAFNTLGAITGSLACGFLLLPNLGALGSWKLTVWVLLVLAVVALWLHLEEGGRRRAIAAPLAVISVTVVMIHASLGPTAFWRHSPIGAGRAEEDYESGTRNGLKRAIHERRRGMSWEADGRETTVGLYTLNDSSFLVNGKSDGAAVIDGGTQVMGGLIGALVKPGSVKRALVIGLGTGSTTGWLAKLPEVEQVDVVELEPAILDVARRCAVVNQHVLENPKVNVIIGDAREVLLSTPHKYDLIFSEPSNPYRAGIASLFTREFYEAARQRLNEGGVFAQWVQAYEIDAKSIRTIYTTLAAVFPSLESWRSKSSDLILLGRQQDPVLDLDLVRQRLQQTPFKEALMAVWRVHTVEGVISRYVARPELARAIAEQEGPSNINTDDRNLLEFSIVRALGRPHDFDVTVLMELATKRGEAWPTMVGSGAELISWEEVYDEMVALRVVEGSWPEHPPNITPNNAMRKRRSAVESWQKDKPQSAIKFWGQQEGVPNSATELMILADSYANAADEEATMPLVRQLEELMPQEAAAITARLHYMRGDPTAAWKVLKPLFEGYRTEPWPNNKLMTSVMNMMGEIAKTDPLIGSEAQQLLKVELAVYSLHYLRTDLRLDIALKYQDGPTCIDALREFTEWVPWYEDFLRKRIECYELAKDPRLQKAKDDLAAYEDDEGLDFTWGLSPTEAKEARAVPSSEPVVAASASASASASPSAPLDIESVVASIATFP